MCARADKQAVASPERKRSQAVCEALDALEDPLHVVDRDLRIIVVNERLRRWCEELGVPSDLVGKHVFEAFPFLKDAIRDEYRTVLESGQPLVTDEVTVVDGHTIASRIHKIPICENGAVVRVVTVMRDTTERHETQVALRDREARLKDLESIINRSPVMVFLWRLADDFPVEFASENVRRLGYSAEDFTSGRVSWPGITHPHDEGRLRAEVDAHLAMGGDSWTQRYRIRTALGEWRWLEDNNLVIRNPAGEPTHIQGIVTDITERRRLEHEVMGISRREQERLGQDLHDSLGQQLTGIGFLTGALGREMGAASPHAEAVARIGALVRDAVSETRLIARGLTPVDVAEEGLAESLRQLATDTRERFRLSCECEEVGNAIVHDNAVATQLFYVAQEAVTNAVRHAEPTHILIDLRTDGESGLLTIQDDGVGMREDKGNPSGMGLRIMRMRAENVGGALVIEPVATGGTRVKCGFANLSRSKSG